MSESQYTHDDVLDAAHAVLTSDCDKLTICSQLPTTFVEANATYALGDATPSFTGPTNGDVSGRKLTVNAVSAATVDADGNANHVALLDTSGSRLLRTTPCYPKTGGSGTAQAGASTTITLKAGDTAADDAYNDHYIVITGGTGEGQSRKITDFVNSTKVATVASAWTTNPDSTSVYQIYGQQVSTGNTFSLDAFDIEILDAVQ